LNCPRDLLNSPQQPNSHTSIQLRIPRASQEFGRDVWPPCSFYILPFHARRGIVFPGAKFNKQEEYNAPVLLFDKVPCRIRPHRHASVAIRRAGVLRGTYTGRRILAIVHRLRSMCEATSSKIHQKIWEIHANPSKAELHQRWHPNWTSEGLATR